MSLAESVLAAANHLENGGQEGYTVVEDQEVPVEGIEEETPVEDAEEEETTDELDEASLEEAKRLYKALKDPNQATAVVSALAGQMGLLRNPPETKAEVKEAKKDVKEKEEKFTAFSKGQIRVLVTKPKIGAWGLNFQHCAHMTFFPSHSYEQYYQAVRRCWRFGQKKEVVVDIVTTAGEEKVLKNLQRKSKAADKMFNNLVSEMNNSIKIKQEVFGKYKEELPSWL